MEYMAFGSEMIDTGLGISIQSHLLVFGLTITKVGHNSRTVSA